MALSIVCILTGAIALIALIIPFIRSLYWQHTNAEIIDNRIEIERDRSGFHKFEFPEYEFEHENNWFRYTQHKHVKWSPLKINNPITKNPKFFYELNSKIKICFNKQKPNHSFILPHYLHLKIFTSIALLSFGAYIFQKS
jgi:hypothetical protein